MVAVDADEVSAIVRDVAISSVLPRWRMLAHDDVQEKSPGEPVTSADRAAEAVLSRRLREVLPEAIVVGEEAASTDPALLDALEHAPLVWLVDALDGTANFVAGSPEFAVMVALVEHGETVASWIECPALGRSYVAVRSEGAFSSGTRLHIEQPRDASDLRGAALTRFLDDEQRVALTAFADTVATLGPGTACAGVDYPLVAEGAHDFVLFWRTLPWDHAPGALLVTEAGGVVAHLDGAPYRPSAPRNGLIAACDRSVHTTVSAALSRRPTETL